MAWKLMAAVLVITGAVSTGSRTADAQVLYGSLVGTVRDSSGGAVPGATVTATNQSTGLVLETVSNETGAFSIANVLPGPYNVSATLQGFREFVRTGVPVTANTVSRVEAVLEVGALEEVITVASEVRLLQTDRADVHTEISAKEVTDLPLPAYRNYQSLMNLVPGATPTVEQNALTDTPARSLRTFVGGQNPNTNTTTTDGALNMNLWLPHHDMYVSPAETIDTVNVSTSSFTAEQGQAGGAAVTVLTKSGTNQFSGSAFEFFNNEGLNARPFFDPDKLPMDRHIAGGTLGGPIVQNRLFFFGSYEGFFERSSAFQFLNVPTDALRGGDFSNAVNADGSLQVIYDPLTGNADGTGRQPFPNNAIPADRMSPAALRVLEHYPLTNTGGEHDATRNYLRQNDTTVDRHNMDVKINWNRTNAHQIWGKYSQMNADVGNLFYLGVDGAGNGDTKVYQSTFGHTWTLGPTMVLDSTFGFSRQDQQVVASDFELGFFGQEVLGIPGTNAGSGQFAGDTRYAGFPQFNTGFSALGNNAGWNPLFRDERTYAITTNLTKIAGSHELRFGYSGNYLYLDHWQPEIANPRGSFDFSGNITALNGGQTANFYNNYASFLLGQVSNVSKSIQYELMTAREWQHALYVNDRWNVSDRMTLNLGLRYEYYPLMSRADRGIEQVDLNTMEVLLGGVGGNPDDLGINVSSGLFAPRLGLVYRIDDDTIFRTGYGMTFNPLPFARPLRGFYPLTIASSFPTDNPWQPASQLDNGIPEVVGPDLSSGRIPLPPSVSMRTPEEDVSRGRIHSWNVALERRLPANISVDLAYVGTRGTDGYADLDINASDTPGGGNASRPFFDEFGRNIALNSWGPRIETRYHSLQMAVNRPFSNGLLLKGAYTWSKSMGETTSGEDGWVGVAWNAPSQYHRNYALQPFDRTHVFQLGFLYELPFARNTTGLVNALADGWQVNGIFFAYSGVPFTVTASGAQLDMPGNLQTADQVGEIRVLGNIGDDGPYFDPSAWAQPDGVRFGDSGRSSVRGPGGWGTDLSLFRGFRISGTHRVEFRAEAFNVFNHPIFNGPAGLGGAQNHAITSATFMHVFSTQVAPRTIRLGLRYSF